MYERVKTELRDLYDANASMRDETGISDWKAGERADFLSSLQAEGLTRLLEIGSGPGRDGLFFQENGLRVVCTDLSPQMVECCRRKGLEAHVMDFLSLEFPNRSFDAIYALNCLLHVPRKDLPEVLARIDALLKPGGLFYCGVYGGRDFEGIWDEDEQDPKRFFSYYTDDGIRAVMEQRFRVERFRRIDTGRAGNLHFQSMLLRSSPQAELPRESA